MRNGGQVTAVELPNGIKFQRARALIRTALTEVGVARRIDALVAQLLDDGHPMASQT
jgi:hypothetical protein